MRSGPLLSLMCSNSYNNSVCDRDILDNVISRTSRLLWSERIDGEVEICAGYKKCLKHEAQSHRGRGQWASLSFDCPWGKRCSDPRIEII